MNKLTLILASTSIYRRGLLEKLGIPFICEKPNIDETPLDNESPTDLVTRLAQQKAEAVSAPFDQALIIGSDQIALHNDAILGKPHTRENAIAQLASFSGQSVTFLTSLCLYNTATKTAETIVDETVVHFRQLTDEQISHYVDVELPLDCAGSFKSEGFGISLFEKITSSDPNSLIGLPLIQLVRLLSKQGVDVLSKQ
ncbi:Maf family protein [Thalassotalea agarivorans]|uniref:7-methyl-GTP pyrophosphatase n=1 Tax=Thalassotalea agarivorans TaxID=349064 RepID=A0A1I0ET95_THASX|nr:nucleoside triphosphate pyrophosphatase [Thalassotalea agarivorans]SET48733.1 MAF protein [Thalassotalea agarivorans]